MAPDRKLTPDVPGPNTTVPTEAAIALTTLDGAVGLAPAELQLMVLGPDDFVAKFALPSSGTLSIGRGTGVQVDLPDRSVSRQHAVLHVGPGSSFLIEDLGSANGTQVGRSRLAPGERVRLEVGEVAFIGRTVAIVQARHGRPEKPAPLPPDRLQAGLAALADGAAPRGCLLLLEPLDGSLADGVAEAVGTTLEPGDLFVDLGGCQYAILLDAAGERADDLERRREALVTALTQLGPALGVGEARLPEDGRLPESLLAIARRRLEASCLAVDSERQVVFHDPRMRKLHELGRHAAAGLINVLLLGETGVGKDVFARAIHRLSPRRNQTFQRIECAALTEALAESELFGHARGAFTGAMRDKPGLLEMADGGTVFLDEVGELPPRLQAKLLHVLETRRITRVGAVEGFTIDLRFIAATNRDLEAESQTGGFRRDLYYRLCGFTLAIPPLRERRGDIAPLARALVRQCVQRLGRDQVPTLTPAAIAVLMAHDWPGNVRELRNAIERAVLICRNGRIEADHLLLEAIRPGAPAAAPGRAAEMPAPEPLRVDRDTEKRRIEEALASCGGNQSRAAKLLGMARSTLVLRLEAHGIIRPRKRE
jgi:two-component system response regulator AtoC